MTGQSWAGDPKDAPWNRNAERDLSKCAHGSALLATASSGGQYNGVTILLDCTYEDGCTLRFVARSRA